ncbi:dienelactone hydrolase family protein [Xanthocytophaga agilis]|uniref:Dienelactone hydrolase family protein n=1 Tax=Xanthocytophaga agilis TaxID=3048010 RepID=A0AAE3R6G2_9BACT|nr:dienelactone hydrolase family protein [Xanthocytophaga agilis]MDJ1502354.1 dienelactone hydrolase family protein [Xanthocytophaga agilis]
MKRLLFTCFTLLATGIFTFAQKVESCCQISATDAMARLVDDPEFVASHLAPLPYVYKGKDGKMITFKTTDGKTANAFELKAKTKSNKYLFVFQEWWGLNDYIKRESEKYYNDLKGEVTVIALDMYDGKVATDPETAGKYMGEAKPERLDAITKGAVEYVGKDAKIATVGWCFGGARSLQAALVSGKQAVGCVMFYGMPEKDVNRLKTLHTDVLGLFAGREKWINSEVVSQFEKDMQAAGKKVTVKTFDAEHAFANPSNPNYDKAKADEAYMMAINYLKEKFKV